MTEAVKLAPALTFPEAVGEPWALMTVILNVDCATEIEVKAKLVVDVCEEVGVGVVGLGVGVVVGEGVGLVVGSCVGDGEVVGAGAEVGPGVGIGVCVISAVKTAFIV